MIDILVSGEKVTVSEEKLLIKGSVGQYYCNVKFDSDWNDYEKYIIFYVGAHQKSIRIDSSSEVVEVPPELLTRCGYLAIGAVGIKRDREQLLRKHTNVYRYISIVPGTSYEDVQKPYTSMQKLDDYLWKVEYDELNYSAARRYFLENIPPVSGACSAVRKDNLVLGTFDWFYNNQPSFVVKVKRGVLKHASIGVAGGVPELTECFVESGANSPMYDILPFMVNSGVNEYGVCVKTNVVPAEKDCTISEPMVEQVQSISSIELVRYILNNFMTARAAVEYIRDFVCVYFSKSLADMGYQQHFMVADKTSTYILEFVNNHAVIIEKPYMTNFHLDGVIFNSDGKVLTPETQTAEDNAETVNHITPHGSGLERFNIIVDSYDNLTSMEAMESLVNELRYTSAYEGSPNEANPKWYTEFVNEELTVGKLAADFTETYAKAGEYYASRTREAAATWQTVHAAIYDLDIPTLTLFSQEGSTEHTFTL